MTTAKTRKEMNKSGKMPCQICGDIGILHQHHIRGRDIPNPNHPSNLVNVCPNCHMKLHYDQIVIEGWVMSTMGQELLWHKKGVEGLTGDDAKPNLLV